MTTIGVRADPPLRALPMRIPSYSYQYPSLRRVKLTAVKHGLFHPRIPTFRRMDMDTMANRLPDEHSRTTTNCTSADFERSTTSYFPPPGERISCLGITETATNLYRCQTAPDSTKKSRDEWSQFLNKCPERFDIQLPQFPRREDLHFTGYAVRYLKPEISCSWKYALRQEPELIDQRTQMPIPANIYGRYRNPHPDHRGGRYTAQAWRC